MFIYWEAEMEKLRKERKNKMLSDHRKKLLDATGNRLEHINSLLATLHRRPDPMFPLIWEEKLQMTNTNFLHRYHKFTKNRQHFQHLKSFLFVICELSGFLYPKDAGGELHSSI
jgi:hypothetical protein